MFKGLFKRGATNKEIILFNPIEGEIISIDKVPDQVFAQKMLGDGFGIIPTGNKVYAPASGEIKVLFPTLHAVAIETPEGLELLIHIGIDTVGLNGEGFTAHVKVGDRVKQGDLLITFDKQIIESKATSSTTPVIITNMDIVEDFTVDYGIRNSNEAIGNITKKYVIK